jgi:hypothetical protein
MWKNLNKLEELNLNLDDNKIKQFFNPFAFK